MRRFGLTQIGFYGFYGFIGLAFGAFPTLAQSAYFDPEVAIERVQKECAERDWSQVECDFDVKAQPGQYRSDPLSETAEIIAPPFRSFAMFLGKFIVPGRTKKESKIRDRLTSMLKDTQTAQKLSTCQSACLVTCATGYYGDHFSTRDERDNDPASGQGLLLSGYAVCSDFTQVARSLAKKLGLKTRAQMGGILYGAPHEFMKVKIDGAWWNMEPQSVACRFFRATEPRAKKATGARGGNLR